MACDGRWQMPMADQWSVGFRVDGIAYMFNDFDAAEKAAGGPLGKPVTACRLAHAVPVSKVAVTRTFSVKMEEIE
jgi:hypothetical protein